MESSFTSKSGAVAHRATQRDRGKPMDKVQVTQNSPKGESVTLMYPSNQLKAQVRPIDQTLSAFTVLKEAFFTTK